MKVCPCSTGSWQVQPAARLNELMSSWDLAFFLAFTDVNSQCRLYLVQFCTTLLEKWQMMENRDARDGMHTLLSLEILSHTHRALPVLPVLSQAVCNLPVAWSAVSAVLHHLVRNVVHSTESACRMLHALSSFLRNSVSCAQSLAYTTGSQLGNHMCFHSFTCIDCFSGSQSYPSGGIQSQGGLSRICTFLFPQQLIPLLPEAHLSCMQSGIGNQLVDAAPGFMATERQP